jgi:hypothetical protein
MEGIKTFKWLSTTFKTSIKRMKNIVVVVSSLDDPNNAFTRAWCVFEMFCAIDTRCNFEVAFFSEDYKQYSADKKREKIEAINANKCSASEDSELALIKRTIIKYAGGMDSFNREIREAVMWQFKDY